MEILAALNDKVVWGFPMLALMLFTGVYFTLRTRFFQLRSFPKILRETVFSRDRNDGAGISPFAAMCQALAATLGTGNIAGVSTALSIGGAGAVFWMWVSAVFGMMTGFAENVLGMLYRQKRGGRYYGGAMRYIKDGLSESPVTKPLAAPLSVIYAALCLFAGFGMGNAAQMNSAAEALDSGFGLPRLMTGIVLALTAALIIFGGVKRISSVTSGLVPIMSGFYIIGCLYIIISGAERIPAALDMIVGSAFGWRAAGGGLAGAAVKTAVSMGFRRGVFSNEAGLGTSVLSHSQSRLSSPVICGMWSVFEVFFDTIVMCGMTALVLLVSGSDLPAELPPVTSETQYFRLTAADSLITDGTELPGTMTVYGIHGELLEAEVTPGLTYSNIMTVTGEERGGRIVSAKIEPLRGAGLAERAFSARFGKPAGALLGLLTAMFAFSTVIGWSWFGAEAAEFLFGSRSRKPFCVMFIGFAVAGACINMEAAWGIADMLNGLMAVPNLAAVLLLSPKVLGAVREYERKTRRAKSPQTPDKANGARNS